jgi:hypothetical protein
MAFLELKPGLVAKDDFALLRNELIAYSDISLFLFLVISILKHLGAWSSKYCIPYHFVQRLVFIAPFEVRGP